MDPLYKMLTWDRDIAVLRCLLLGRITWSRLLRLGLEEIRMIHYSLLNESIFHKDHSHVLQGIQLATQLLIA